MYENLCSGVCALFADILRRSDHAWFGSFWRWLSCWFSAGVGCSTLDLVHAVTSSMERILSVMCVPAPCVGSVVDIGHLVRPNKKLILTNTNFSKRNSKGSVTGFC